MPSFHTTCLCLPACLPDPQIFFVSGKNHNLPHVPRILRILAGYVAGAAVSIAEPAYKTFMDWWVRGLHASPCECLVQLMYPSSFSSRLG
jgi:hypothetical protein